MITSWQMKKGRSATPALHHARMAGASVLLTGLLCSAPSRSFSGPSDRKSDAAPVALSNIAISLHCWQGDDVQVEHPLPGLVALHDHGGFNFYGKEKIADGPDVTPEVLIAYRE